MISQISETLSIQAHPDARPTLHITQPFEPILEGFVTPFGDVVVDLGKDMSA